MWIRTRLASAGMSLDARVPTQDNPLTLQESVAFELLPTDDRDHLDLDTGEVFQDYSFARLHKNDKKLISANITIRPSRDDSDYQYNLMRYMGEQTGDDFNHPSSIDLNVFIAPTAFRQLIDNLRGGLYPGTITIELADEARFFKTSTNPKTKAPIEFGWEPDGSGMIWHNKEHRTIPIESVRFDYSIVKPRFDQETHRPLPMLFNAPTDRINEQMTLIQGRLMEMLKYSRWITMGVSALAIMIGISIVKRGF